MNKEAIQKDAKPRIRKGDAGVINKPHTQPACLHLAFHNIIASMFAGFNSGTLGGQISNASGNNTSDRLP